MEIFLIYITFLILAIWLAAIASLRRVVIFDYEQGLLYRSGHFQKILQPGRHWLWKPLHTYQKIDFRIRYVTLAGQEVLSFDNVSLKISLVASFKIQDPVKALHTTVNFLEALYLVLQIRLRELVGAVAIDDLMEKRPALGQQLLEAVRPQASEFGLELLSVDIKDIMFPGELKNIFAQVVNARKEGLAALERARGESASLRNLANTAKLLENNPELFQLRLLQAVGAASGNTIVFGSTGQELLVKKPAPGK